MNRLVVDASVAVKWLLPEILDREALRLTEPRYELFAPDLILAEVGSALGRRVGRAEITSEAAMIALEGLSRMGLDLHPLGLYALAALDLACRLRQSLYDCVYLALAIRLDVAVVTADRRFFDAVAHGPLRNRIAWIEDAARA